MTVATMRKATGLTQRQFAEALEIPVRTLQQWEQGRSTPPEYVLKMIEKLLPALTPSQTSPQSSKLRIPEKTRWRICIPNAFKNADRIYPIQQQKVRELLNDITADPAVEKVVVFGSSVTQNCHIGSDVDLFVEMSENRNPVSETHNFPFDLWTNFTADNRLKSEITEKGVVVYG